MRTILVGYDETDPSKRALDRAASIADAFDARLLVASVAPGLHGREAGPLDTTDAPVDPAAELVHARVYLEQRGTSAGYVEAIGDPAEAINMIAEEHDVDLIVVGTREAGFIERVRRPSVSRDVSRRSHRDVLVVHPA